MAASGCRNKDNIIGKYKLRKLFWNLQVSKSSIYVWHNATSNINFIILQIDLITESKKWKTGSKHWKKRKINCRINPPEKSVLKICIKFIGEHPCRSVISIKLQNNFIEITLRHGCSPVNLLHIFKTHCPKNTPGGLLLNCQRWKSRS